MKTNERMRAIDLRKRGVSFGEILKEVGVSKSTLGLWLRNVELTPSQELKALRGREISRLAAARLKKKRRVELTDRLIAEGKNQFPELMKTPIFLSGLALYWAEGDKNRQERVKFTNSDEKMIILMMRWFREICHVPEEKFRIALHIHNLHVPKNVKSHWSRITGVPKDQFQKLYIKRSSLGHRRNILYNGTCAIVINSKNLFRKILGWKLGLLDYFKILNNNIAK